MEAALALPARFGERSMATKSVFQLTGRAGTRDSNLKRRGWSTQRFRAGEFRRARGTLEYASTTETHSRRSACRGNVLPIKLANRAHTAQVR